MNVARKFRGTVAVGLFLLTLVSTATAKYSGGTGEPNDPYRIATAADLIALGETPADYDKHFILTADIDLDPSLPGRRVFDKAIIAPDTNDMVGGFQGTSFGGVFDGKGHRISHLAIKGGGYLGLFGQLSSGTEVDQLGVVDVNITGSGGNVAGLVGYNYGDVTRCYSSGTVRGSGPVGGLVGENNGAVTQCYSTGTVDGNDLVGGLVGCNYAGYITDCYSTCAVSGVDSVGGLVGADDFDVEQTGGALIMGSVSRCYSTGIVVGNTIVGGLVGKNCLSFEGAEICCTEVVGCFWDIETSGQATSSSGTGKTTAEMKMAGTFVGWWYGSIWTIDEGRDYPRLRWENAPGEIIRPLYYSGGAGTSDDPYLIYTGAQLNAIGLLVCDWDKDFRLMADIDLSAHAGTAFNIIGTPDMPFTGVFDGNGYTISRLTLTGGSHLGLFGQLDWGAEVRNLGVVDVNVVGSSDHVGGLVGYNRGGVVTACYSTGAVRGGSNVGGLLGWNYGAVTRCYSTATVGGDSLYVGGLVGFNWYGDVTQCYSTGTVNGNHYVGGLVGENEGNVTDCYSTGTVSSASHVGGLVGDNWGHVTHCYSAGKVGGWASLCVGGLVGLRWSGSVTNCFWDIQTSRQTDSSAGTGRTTVEMQTASTFLDAGWDFVGETANGSEDIWKIAEGLGYPRLSWEKYTGGTGEPNDPYQIATPEDLMLLGDSPEDYDKHFILTADIDLDPNLPGRKVFDRAVIAPDTDETKDWFQGTPFTGIFDGSMHTVSHLTVTGTDCLGLFGQLGSWDALACQVKNLGVVDIYVTGSGNYVGGLAGENHGTVTQCHSTGLVSSTGQFSHNTGGLVGQNGGTLTQCCSSAAVSGQSYIGGLVGWNLGAVTQSYSAGSVSGDSHVGGLVGHHEGTATDCYSTSAVSGNERVGGLMGVNDDIVTGCHSTGAISGATQVGGLVGCNGYDWGGGIIHCYSTGAVSGTGWSVGGLVGYNSENRQVAECYSTGSVSGGDGGVGGLVGENYYGFVTNCYSTGSVSGGSGVGGLVGANCVGHVKLCYSTGGVSGTGQDIGGLVGGNYPPESGMGTCVSIDASFWDIQTSGQATSDGGTGKTTAEMQTAKTFTDAGWDFVDETANGTDDIWSINEGKDYPRLWWEAGGEASRWIKDQQSNGKITE